MTDVTLDYWLEQLDRGWDVTLSDDFDSTTEDAYVLKNREEYSATIHIRPDVTATWNAGRWERLLVHELLHLVFDDLEYLASNNRSIEVQDIIHVELERTINILSTTLTGQGYEPMEPYDKA